MNMTPFPDSDINPIHNKSGIEPVEIFICEPERELFDSLKSSLLREGLGHIYGYFSLEALSKAIETRLPDLIIVDYSIDGEENVASLIKNLRHAKIGRNPFVPIIATMWEPNAIIVSKMIDLGVDAIITKPISIKQIILRFNSLLQGRKPFVVSSQYIGPDRRSDANRPSPLPLIEPPNTIRNKVLKQDADPQSIRKLIANAVTILHYQRLKRNSLHFMFLIELIMYDYRENQLRGLPRYLKELNDVLRDLVQRLPGSEFKDALPMCQSLYQHMCYLKDNAMNIDLDMLAQMKELIEQIAFYLNKDRNSDEITAEIKDSVQSYLKRFQAKPST